MNTRNTLWAAAVAALVPSFSAQIVNSVGPPVAPLGGFVAITISNEGSTTIEIGEACPFQVRRASDGALIYDAVCPTFVAITVAPGDEAVFLWDQRDINWNPVPPDSYNVIVESPDGTLPSFPLTIGAVDAGVDFLGVPSIGSTRDLLLTATPAHVGELYFLMAARTTTGIPTCAGTVPLFPDGIFFDSINPGSAVFSSFTGLLNPVIAFSQEPSVAIPFLPGLIGQQVSFSFVTLDFSQPCIVTAISPADTVVLQ